MKDATKNIEWLESMRELNNAKKVEKCKLISLKIEPSFLEAFKYKCKVENSPYTTKIKELMLKYLNE